MELLDSRESSLTETTKRVSHSHHAQNNVARQKSVDRVNFRLLSFRMLDSGIPIDGSPEKRLAWLRSQMIGNDVEFESPFGKRRLTYADYTASGRCLQFIENYIIENVLPFYGNTHTSDSFVGHQTTKMVHEASDYIKSCLGGKEDDALVFVGSGTTGAIKRLQEVMGIAIPSTMRERVLKILKIEERWVIFVGPFEHHSNLLSWRQSLAEVIEIGLNEEGLVDVEALKNQLETYQRTNRPMLGSFSACSNVTGIYTDTRALASLLHHYGAFACFDFAASGPYVDIDMRSGEIDGYDAIFLSPHKFAGGPGSPGILLMSKILYRLQSSPPSTCGGGTVSYVNPYDEKDTLYCDNVEEREDAGTSQIIQKIRASLAFWVKEYIGYEVIENHENKFVAMALNRLLPNPNIWILGNTSAKRQAILSFLIHTTSNSSPIDKQNELGIGSDANNGGERNIFMWREFGNVKDKPLHGPFVAKLLNDLFGIQARGGCSCAGPYGHYLLEVDEFHSLAFRSAIQKGFSGVKPGWTRVDFSYFMLKEEFEFILAAMEFIAMYGQRFLALYKFNWKTGVWTFKKKAFKENLFGRPEVSRFNVTTPTKQSDQMLNKYVSYLESAKQIAHSLPKFPPRKIPEDIDLKALYFRV
ncbi:Aminotransferase class V domain [Dillenia turbinata]|uniref:Aminotransferase class V domain n=1 Tax=Dillenia turbinata TaxID=194707 RepID=A0AAN8VYW8_9MAGN